MHHTCMDPRASPSDLHGGVERRRVARGQCGAPAASASNGNGPTRQAPALAGIVPGYGACLLMATSLAARPCLTKGGHICMSKERIARCAVWMWARANILPPPPPLPVVCNFLGCGRTTLIRAQLCPVPIATAPLSLAAGATDQCHVAVGTRAPSRISSAPMSRLAHMGSMWPSIGSLSHPCRRGKPGIRATRPIISEWRSAQ